MTTRQQLPHPRAAAFNARQQVTRAAGPRASRALPTAAMRPRNHRRGFTVPKLLAMILLTGLLLLFLSALVPSPSRTTSHRATCFANMHQIGVALRLYKDEHDGVYPEALYGFNYPGGVSAGVGPDGNPLPAVTGLYPQYFNYKQLLRCPRAPCALDDPGMVRGWHPTIGFAHHPQRLYPIWDSYDGQLEPPETTGLYAVRYVKHWSAEQSHVVRRLELGSGKPADETVVTWCTYHADYRDGNVQPGSPALVLFLDGHVKPVPAIRMSPVTIGCTVPPGRSYRVGLGG